MTIICIIIIIIIGMMCCFFVADLVQELHEGPDVDLRVLTHRAKGLPIAQQVN